MDRRDHTEPNDVILMGLAQLQRYLGDEAAPMMVADSIQPLLTEPPELVMPVIRDWITDQRRVEGPELTVGESLFHAGGAHLLAHPAEAHRQGFDDGVYPEPWAPRP